ncbi:DUF4829 domain-containing protein [Clostridium niameyense]|uniref:DUF4829 domain-containing protein n=1 Tax=Clostridium niameyense TaxID=1622073 RepID=A0A6M0R9T5_9CLOT|nr:DUF4829 domain-containing protein [Clostridium niameyense]NEZ46993.1 DUF4829 domain-containing protein [Clostridium niameyense]
MKKQLLLIILLSLIVLIGCCKFNDNGKLLESDKVIQNYFKYYNNKNKKGVLSTLTKNTCTFNVMFNFGNLKYIKLENIKEDNDLKQKEAYIKYGRGNVDGAKKENVIIYKVKYKVKYKNDKFGPEDGGEYVKWFTLIRKDKNSPWLIDDIGEG